VVAEQLRLAAEEAVRYREAALVKTLVKALTGTSWGRTWDDPEKLNEGPGGARTTILDKQQ